MIYIATCHIDKACVVTKAKWIVVSVVYTSNTFSKMCCYTGTPNNVFPFEYSH